MGIDVNIGKSPEDTKSYTPGEDTDNGGGPWCYTSDESRGWDRCNIPVCGGKTIYRDPYT